MKKRISLLLALCLLFLSLSAFAEPAERPVIRITVQDFGDIYAELYPDTAPVTVENFLSLVDSGFYNGLTFHRIISGFMIQGGDPLGNGTGGSEKKIKGEFSRNGVDNPVLHTRGVLSMARSSDMDSASSQFFIMHDDASHLDGAYAAFGRVLSGMEIVDAICRDTPVTDGNGTVIKEDQPVMLEVVRASREDAESAAAREAENGTAGVYRDSVLGYSIPIPEGWSLQSRNGGTLLFRNESGASIQMVAQNLWRRFGSAFRASAEADGKGREILNTAYFGDQLTQAVSGTENMTFTPTEYNGLSFYTAFAEANGSPVWVRVGAADGLLLCFIGIGEGAGETLDRMMNGLELP